MGYETIKLKYIKIPVLKNYYLWKNLWKDLGLLGLKKIRFTENASGKPEIIYIIQQSFCG